MKGQIVGRSIFLFFSRWHAIRSHFPLKWRCDKRERRPNVGFPLPGNRKWSRATSSPLICIWNEQPRRSRFVAPVIYLYCPDRVTLLNKLQLVPVVFLSDVERNFRFPNSRSDFFLRLEIKFMDIFNNIGSFEGKGRKDNLFFFFWENLFEKWND